MDKIQSRAEREWYIHKTVENGWSRNVLVHWIESGLYERQGKASTNFERTLPKPQSDLARKTLKDPYKFEFLTLAEEAEEKAVEEEASKRQGVEVERVCFVDALRWLVEAEPGNDLPRLKVNPDRFGRVEPRVRKRRAKQYPLMTKRHRPKAARYRGMTA